MNIKKMKYNKKLLFILIISITIITLNSINAQELNDTTTIVHNHEIKETQVLNNEKTIKTDTAVEVSSYDELYESINNTSETSKNQTINLNPGNYNITNDINVQGAKKGITIIINGNNQIIDGNNLNSFIKIQKSNTLIINNLKITKTRSNSANTIMNYGKCVLNNVSITNTYTEYKNSSGGGAIFNQGTLEVYNSQFINNSFDTPTFGGAAIYNINNLTVNNSLFENNSCPDGSAIYSLNSKNTSIENSVFKNNNATTSTIYNLNSRIIIKNSIFENNTGKYPITYQLNTGITSIENCNISQHSSYGLIYNHNNTIITKCQIFKNKINNSMFFNENGNMTINNSSITQNEGRLISNDKQFIINNSIFVKNDANDPLIENINENAIIIIEKSEFTNNTATNILKDVLAKTYVYDCDYCNNTCQELFEGNIDQIKASNNTYIGNNLSSYIFVNNNHTFNYDENITIEGNVTTKEVYNTTINSGNIYLYLNDTLLSYSDVKLGKFKAVSDEKILNNSKIGIVFNDTPNYKPNIKNTTITILSPKYDIKIVTDDSFEYNKSFTYCIILRNIGDGNASNISIDNIIPNNVNYISCDNPGFDYENCSWNIPRLNVNESCNLTLLVKSYNNENILLNITLSDSGKDNITTLKKELTIKNPSIYLTVEDNMDNLCLSDKLRLNININNNGTGRSGNINLKVIKDGNLIYNNIFAPLESEDYLELLVESLINKTGKYNVSIILTDEIFNTEEHKEFSLNIRNVSVILDDINAHVNDIVNLNAHVNNINSLENATVVFKINSLTITDHQIIIKNNTIELLNFKIPSQWKKNNYTVEVKVYKKGFEQVLIAKSILFINKLKVYSKVYDVVGFPKDKINLTAIITDEKNNKVNVGIAKFKINGITIHETIHVRNGLAQLSNFVIPERFRGTKYNLSLVYAENSLYFSNRNYSTITLEKQESAIEITNTTFIRKSNFTIYARIYGKHNNLSAFGGKVIFKINRKTVSGVMDVSSDVMSYTYENIPIRNLDCITVVYSGNNILLGCRCTIGENKFNYK